jgi:hypothetical protein
MKWFRIVFRVQTGPTLMPTHCPSGAERMRYVNVFRSRASSYRRRKFIAAALIGAFIFACAGFAKTRVGDLLGVGGAVLLLAWWLGAVLILFLGLRLKCPACRKGLMPAAGPYCPQCGSDQYAKGRHQRGPIASRHAYCPTCDCTIYDGDNEQPRTYRIRGCTHCGVMLDERGL